MTVRLAESGRAKPLDRADVLVRMDGQVFASRAAEPCPCAEGCDDENGRRSGPASRLPCGLQCAGCGPNRCCIKRNLQREVAEANEQRLRRQARRSLRQRPASKFLEKSQSIAPGRQSCGVALRPSALPLRRTVSQRRSLRTNNASVCREKLLGLR